MPQSRVVDGTVHVLARPHPCRLHGMQLINECGRPSLLTWSSSPVNLRLNCILRNQAEYVAIQQQNESCIQVYYDASITNVMLNCPMEKLSNDNTNGAIVEYVDDTNIDGCSSPSLSSSSLSSSLLPSSLVCIRKGTSLSIRSHSM